MICFSNQESESTMSYILGVKWLIGCSKVMKFIQYAIYWEKNNLKNSLRQNECYKKALFFFSLSQAPALIQFYF